MPRPQYREGEKVHYKPVGGPESKTSESVGTIQQVSTQPTEMTGRRVQASEDEPRYEIKNDRTGKHTAIKEANILGPAE
ncbi:hypothetical protein CNMCM5793_009466 [Aspergillus hiratsukae]|uniref:Hypervirulence associated protein TUDOR domain-containing protein n=1 Tax=Aspergillus hiratsukae TaxID=1194566 RepID=A0A8H6P929_9EURO|nr:hypothetical protein CNMCM5793_009466 [Aspergillus hiratsukae]KAF7170630.1 hypothetical protein CNMCM6106_005255 [Aspergillus hiratsukae]